MIAILAPWLVQIDLKFVRRCK